MVIKNIARGAASIHQATTKCLLKLSSEAGGVVGSGGGGVAETKGQQMQKQLGRST